MSANDKSLGRGLNALFNSQIITEAENNSAASPLIHVKIDQLTPNPNQPRQYFNDESLQELADSIKIRGILQPVLARSTQENDKWEIVAGERRWRAAKIAGLEEIPVLVKELDNNGAMITAMMENLHRDNLNPIEEARGLSAIKDFLHLSQTELANALGVQRGTISNILRILNLSEVAQEDLINGRITQGHARCLVVLPKEESEILRKRILETGMSVRATEVVLAYWQKTKHFPWDSPDKSPRAKIQNDPEMKQLAKKISTRLNCQAQIKGNSESGKINLAYSSNEQLYEILEKLGLTLEDQQ